jgi:hypothetical protein
MAEERQLRDLTRKLDETTIETPRSAWRAGASRRSSMRYRPQGFKVGATYRETVARAAALGTDGRRPGLKARLVVVDTPESI